MLKQTKRIFIIVDAISRGGGGIQNTSYLVAKGYKEKRETIVMCNASKSEWIDGVHIIDTGNRKLISRYIFEFFVLKWREKINRSDYIICPMWAYGIVPTILKSLTGVRFGVLTHGNDVIDPKKSTLWFSMKKIFRRKIITHADDVFASSEYTQKLDLERFPQITTKVIHPPIEFKKCDKKQLRNNSIFTLCRIEERKGVQHVINAIYNLKDTFPNIRYYIGGDGPYKSSIKQLIEVYKLQDRVFMLGKISEKEKERLYIESDLFILPSIYVASMGSIEGFGIVFLEANMYGTPVIGSNSGGIPYAIKEGKTGWIVKEGDTLDLQEKISDFYLNKLSYSKENCFTWAEEHDYRAIVKRYVDVIDSKGNEDDNNSNSF